MKRNESGAPRAPLRMQIAWRSITRVFVYAIPGPCPRLLAAPATIMRRADKSQFIVREPGITRAFMHVPLFHHRFANRFASGPIRCASDPRFCFKSTQKSTENIDIVQFYEILSLSYLICTLTRTMYEKTRWLISLAEEIPLLLGSSQFQIFHRDVANKRILF